MEWLGFAPGENGERLTACLRPVALPTAILLVPPVVYFAAGKFARVTSFSGAHGKLRRPRLVFVVPSGQLLSVPVGPRLGEGG